MILELDQVTAVTGAQTHLYPTSVRLAPCAINVLLGPTQAGKQGAMDNLAKEMDQVMGRLRRAGMKNCAPKLNPEGDPGKWLSAEHAPWKKLDNERPKGETVAYDKLLAAWKDGRVR